MSEVNAPTEVPHAKREVKAHTLTCKTDQTNKQVAISLRNFVVFLLVVLETRKVITSVGQIIMSTRCAKSLSEMPRR